MKLPLWLVQFDPGTRRHGGRAEERRGRGCPIRVLARAAGGDETCRGSAGVTQVHGGVVVELKSVEATGVQSGCSE